MDTHNKVMPSIIGVARFAADILIPIGVGAVTQAGLTTIKPNAPKIDTRLGKAAFWIGEKVVAMYITSRVSDHVNSKFDEFEKETLDEEPTDSVTIDNLIELDPFDPVFDLISDTMTDEQKLSVVKLSNRTKTVEEHNE